MRLTAPRPRTGRKSSRTFGRLRSILGRFRRAVPVSDRLRNQGYAQDWALQGATAQGDDLVGYGATFAEEYEGGFSPGLPGLLTQPGGISNINVVNILIGGNDYFRGRTVRSAWTELDQFPQRKNHRVLRAGQRRHRGGASVRRSADRGGESRHAHHRRHDAVDRFHTHYPQPARGVADTGRSEAL